MQTGHNTATTTTLDTLVQKAGAKIAHAIENASQSTGIDFSYLLQQAHVESSFKAEAKASTSSATGLYQFLDKTWLDMVNKYGDKYGLDDEAAKISDSGKVASKTDKKEILELRNDPKICALMAAELACENKQILEKNVSSDIGSTDLYMAHFMGPAAASKFLNALDNNPNAKAASLFPAAASANKSVFYDKSGKAKSIADVYATFDKKFALSETSCMTNQTATVETNTVATTTPKTTPRASIEHNWKNLYQNASAQTQTTTSIKTLGNMGSLISPLDVLEIMKHSDSNRYNG